MNSSHTVSKQSLNIATYLFIFRLIHASSPKLQLKDCTDVLKACEFRQQVFHCMLSL